METYLLTHICMLVSLLIYKQYRQGRAINQHRLVG